MKITPAQPSDSSDSTQHPATSGMSRGLNLMPRSGLATVLALALAAAVSCDQQSQGSPESSDAAVVRTDAISKHNVTGAAVTTVSTTTNTAASAASNAQAADKTLQPVLLADVQKIIAQAKADDKILVIDFWATWCLPCVQMFPELHQKLPAISDKVRVVTITFDSPGKYEALAVDFLRKYDAMHNAYRVGGEAPQWNELIAGLGKEWHDINVPAILVYSPEGILWDEFINERAKPELILSRVQELVKQNQR